MENRENYPVGTRINANSGTTQIPGSFLGRVVIGDPGSAWTLTIQDKASTPNTKVVLKPTAATSLVIGWAFGNQGCQVVAGGTTAGDACFFSG
jgi:hypothetical protein